MFNSNTINRIINVRLSDARGENNTYNIENYKTFDDTIKFNNNIIGFTSQNVVNSFFKNVGTLRFRFLSELTGKLFNDKKLYIGVTDKMLLKNIIGTQFDNRDKYFYFLTKKNDIVLLFSYEGKNVETIPILDIENAMEDYLHIILLYLFNTNLKQFLEVFKEVFVSYYSHLFTTLNLNQQDILKAIFLILAMNKKQVLDEEGLDAKPLVSFFKLLQREDLVYAFEYNMTIEDGEWNNEIILNVKDAILRAAQFALDSNIRFHFARMLVDIIYIIFKYVSSNAHKVEVIKMFEEF